MHPKIDEKPTIYDFHKELPGNHRNKARPKPHPQPQKGNFKRMRKELLSPEDTVSCKGD